jgi:hypothetical protein
VLADRTKRGKEAVVVGFENEEIQQADLYTLTGIKFIDFL